MVIQTQAIRWQQPTHCLSVFDRFVGLALDRLESNHAVAKMRDNDAFV